MITHATGMRFAPPEGWVPTLLQTGVLVIPEGAAREGDRPLEVVLVIGRIASAWSTMDRDVCELDLGDRAQAFATSAQGMSPRAVAALDAEVVYIGPEKAMQARKAGLEQILRTLELPPALPPPT